MRLVICEHILFGRLRPWLIEESAALSVPNKNSGFRDFKTQLEDFPGIIKELESEWRKEMLNSGDVEWLVTFDTQKSFDRKTSWYLRLIKFESRLLGKAETEIKKLNRGEDQVFEANSMLRYLVDLLGHAEKLDVQDEDRQVDYILTQVKYHIMQMILDICLRFERLDGIDRYDEENLFTEVLNSQAPDSPLFYRTPAYLKERLKELLTKNKIDRGFGKLRREITGEIERTGENDQGSPELRKEYLEIINHLENALFLLMMNAPFVDDQPDKLLNADFCREWVQGIRGDFMNEEDAEQASALFSDLLNVSEQFEQVLGSLAGKAEYHPVSQAQRFLSMVREVSERPAEIAAPGVYDRKVEYEKDIPLDFAESFHRRFMSIDEFDSVFRGTREASMRYLKNSNIRILEISREAKYLYRADVERFIEERTLNDE